VSYDLTQRQLQSGYVNMLTLLAAETLYDQALLSRVQAQATRYEDTVALFQALGGGWWNRSAKASAMNPPEHGKIAPALQVVATQ
jgi:outer membrane protein TolC